MEFEALAVLKSLTNVEGLRHRFPWRPAEAVLVFGCLSDSVWSAEKLFLLCFPVLELPAWRLQSGPFSFTHGTAVCRTLPRTLAIAIGYHPAQNMISRSPLCGGPLCPMRALGERMTAMNARCLHPPSKAAKRRFLLEFTLLLPGLPWLLCVWGPVHLLSLLLILSAALPPCLHSFIRFQYMPFC